MEKPDAMGSILKKQNAVGKDGAGMAWGIQSVNISCLWAAEEICSHTSSCPFSWELFSKTLGSPSADNILILLIIQSLGKVIVWNWGMTLRSIP